MKTITLGFIMVIVFSSGVKPTSNQQFDNFCTHFLDGFKALDLSELELSYAQNLKHIQSKEGLQKQESFFEDMAKQLRYYTGQELNKEQEEDFEILTYETNLNLERIALEKKYMNRAPSVIPENNLHSIPYGPQWYAYFLKRWTGAYVNPDAIYLNGMEEIDRVKRHIDSIRTKTGMNDSAFYAYLNDSSFFISNEAQVQQAFEQTERRVLQNMPLLFNVQQFPAISIKKGSSEALAQTPGYYTDNTFYYNLFNGPYNKRQVGWLFLHEGIPGHHYQSSIEQQNSSQVKRLFSYPGFSEGWAAYIEELGKELGAYPTIYDELGKWEWDLVRSVRVPLDVGINYYGWSDEKALAFWKEHIPNQDAIAMREINRIKKWPAQVVTYKYFAMQIMQWKRTLMEQQGSRFDIKDFHDRILMNGSLPFAMVKANVFRKQPS
jgi:uncharacterized protein (DUF885 family)